MQYDGTPAKGKKSIYPNGIVTDNLGTCNIIVTGANIQFLNQNGHILKCLQDVKLMNQFALSVLRDSTWIMKVSNNW